MKVQNILFYTAKWNCYNSFGDLLTTKKFPLKNYVPKQSFSSDNKHFLIEVRWKIPYKFGEKIILPSRASSPHMKSL